MLATWSDLFVPTTIAAPFHALLCRQVLFSLDDITNLLLEFKDVFLIEIPPRLPPLREMEHQIDLIPGAMLPNRAAYRNNTTRNLLIYDVFVVMFCKNFIDMHYL
jgi:hypothetical protein